MCLYVSRTHPHIILIPLLLDASDNLCIERVNPSHALPDYIIITTTGRIRIISAV